MFEKLNAITLSGTEYPIKCDLLVLEQAQKKYGSVNDFERRIMNWEKVLDGNGDEILVEVEGEDGEKVERPKIVGKIPDAEAVLDALYWMASEGAAITAEESGTPCVAPAREKLARVMDKGLMELGGLLHAEFYRCFEGNRIATQNPKTEEKAAN